MNARLQYLLAVSALAVATQAAAQVTFYEHDNFQGRSFTTERPVRNFERDGFNDRASSVEVSDQRWEVCDELRFRGRCVVLRPGRYANLASMGLDEGISSVRSVSANARIDERRYAPVPVATEASAQITFYEREGFGGRSFSMERSLGNFERAGFNDRASSIEVIGGTWEACEDTRFDGRCVVLRPGRYPSLAAMGLNDRVSSVRTISPSTLANDPRYAAARVTPPDFRPRNNERLYEVNVTSVRAIVGPPEQRCWLEREEVVQERGNANVPGAVAGALIGGILGHQVGGGSGKDLATVGGVIAGAALGANVGRNNNAQPAAVQNVQRCETVPSQAQPSSWDVSYNFRGQEHRVQMSAPPGRSITVNEQGEPRR